jgi:hypothetical protein
MALIIQRGYGGMAPSANPKALPETMGTLVLNLDIRYSDFRPMPQPAVVGAAAAGSTLYKFETGGGFITRPTPVNFVRGQIPTDATERTYYTGDGVPKVTDNTGQVRQLGVPSPAAGPVATVNASDEYSTEDSASDQAKILAQMVAATRARLTKTYQGASGVAISPRFTITDQERSPFLIPGSMVGGAFVPTNPSHANLISSDLGFYLTTDDRGTLGNVDLSLRGYSTVIAPDFDATFPVIQDPSIKNRVAKLIDAGDVETLRGSLADGLVSADSVLATNKASLEKLVSKFISTADTGAVLAAQSNAAQVQAFYQRPDVVAAINASVGQIVDSIVAAIATYSNASYTTNPGSGGSTGAP